MKYISVRVDIDFSPSRFCKRESLFLVRFYRLFILLVYLNGPGV